MKANKQISDRYIQSYYKLYGLQLVDSKKEFCEATNLLPQNFSTIENGTRYATLDNIFQLCLTYNVSPEWVITGRGDFFRKPDENVLVKFDENIITKAMDKYNLNKNFTPEKLTDDNLERCVMFYSQKLRNRQ